MIEGEIVYKGHIAGLEIEPIDFHWGSKCISKVVVSSDDDGRATYYVSIIGAEDQLEAREAARGAVTRAADVISFHRGVAVHEPTPVSESLEEVNIGGSEPGVVKGHIGQSLGMMVKASATNKLGQSSLAELKSALSTQASPGELYYPLFRTALDAMDPASRFLGLYLILVMITGDADQATIDRTVEKYEPGVEKSPSPKKLKPGKPPVMETVYTRLRNEYGHDRSVYGATLAKTRAEMDSQVTGLALVVKNAITNGP